MTAQTPESSVTHPGRNRARALGDVRRRPSGEPPPLPRELGRSGKFWLIMTAYFLSVLIGVVVFDGFGDVFDRFNTERLLDVAALRTTWLTDVAEFLAALGNPWTIRILRWGTILALVVFKRWRHLFVFLGAILVLEILTYQMTIALARPRPLGVEIIGVWDGFATPSRPVASFAGTLVGMLYSLVVPGRPRNIGKWIAGVAIVTLAASRVYLAVDRPTDVVYAAIFGVAVMLVAFRWFAPNEAFPVAYRRGKSAHLDVGGRRGEAIEKAVREQLGLTVLDIKPVGLEGSGGSTPLRLRVAATESDPEQYLFAKLYAKTHVRADRWYKLGRTILYGALEDETPFQSVRRFVEYEDYTLRLLQDSGLPTAKPYGIVEITPEREFMIVTEFFKGSVEIGEAEVDDRVIDGGLRLIRNMWDAGLAHRDIKPANLMVRDREVLLIDVFFVQVRPSPWRQAVDLANMMLVLALRSDAKSVYDAALKYFTADEIAEAFAATRGVASPTQLQTEMKRDDRDLLAEFRALAPEREPIKIQRWSLRRVGLTAWVLALSLLALLLVISNWNVFS
jgi:tRNA A-37 threonylcarbamoyl transferase component Bud32/membrane-associated phospholipid phosphatase